MWVVTREENEYYQLGEYFVAVFTDKPDFKALKRVVHEDDVTIGKLTRGGGRQGIEGTWYNLHEIDEGEEFDE